MKQSKQDQVYDAMASRIAEMAFEKLKAKMDQYSDWPPLLSREDLKRFAGIKDNKVSELLNREDFPVTREFGHPRVPLRLLLIWIEEHTDWVRENSPDIDRWAM